MCIRMHLRVCWGASNTVLLGMALAGLLQIVLDNTPSGTISVLWQLPEYALTTMADIFIMVASVEYVYEGRALWPRTGTTAALFATQGLGVLVGALIGMLLPAVGQVVLPALSALALLLNRYALS